MSQGAVVKLLLVLILPLTSCSVGRAGAERLEMRAQFDTTLYSSETGLLSRTMCDGSTVSVEAPIADDVVADIARAAMASDLFSIDTDTDIKPVFTDGERNLFLIDSACASYWFEVSTGDKTRRIGWNCSSAHVGKREEIQRLDRVLIPFMAKLPQRNCPYR